MFDQDRYFDVVVEYAKAEIDDILIRVSVTNRGPEAAECHLLPTLWFRNTWSWQAGSPRPRLAAGRAGVIEADHESLGLRWLSVEGTPDLLFTENETNFERLYGGANATPYVKDGIDDYVVHGRREAVNPEREGTKAAAYYRLRVAPGETVSVRLRLGNSPPHGECLGQEFDSLFARRRQEADASTTRSSPTPSTRTAGGSCARPSRACSGASSSTTTMSGAGSRAIPPFPPPPAERLQGRNHEWTHLYNEDVISMPDKWEYPWYAAWDLAFHAIPLALVDPDFAKEQLILFLREWYMHPNGQIPAYEWALGDVNPPVHAWAAWRVYKIEKRVRGTADRRFLERVFHKLLLNFTWWVNRKDAEGMNVFQGGFLGLDNIGVFDRSAPLPTGGHIDQSDGTSWMGMYCLNMLAIALELAKENPAYEDVASKFFEHFVYIAHAMDHRGGAEDTSLWDEADGFFYDVLHVPGGPTRRMRIRSMVGLIPLFAVETLEPEIVDRLPGFKRRMQWFIDNHPEFRDHVQEVEEPGRGVRRLLSIVTREQLPRCCTTCWTRRSSSRPTVSARCRAYHRDHPFVEQVMGAEYRVSLRAGRVEHRALRRQLELARPDLVSGQLPADRGAAEARPLLRRRGQGGVSDRIRPAHAAPGRERRARAAAGADLPSRRGRAAARARLSREVPDRPALARPDPVPRVLQRRHRRRGRGEPPDRLDRAGGQAPPAAGGRGRATRPRSRRERPARARQGGPGMSRHWAVILAGGDGVRLRSMTRTIAGDDRPKQFCALVSEEALLTETRRRAALAVPAHRTLVVVNRAHERFYTPLLADVRTRLVVAQPENRGTAPAILYALLVLAARQAASDTVALYPSDHFVSDDAAFTGQIEEAFAGAARRPDLVTLLGIAPDRRRPATAGSSRASRSRAPRPSARCAASGRSRPSRTRSACAPRAGSGTASSWSGASRPCWRWSA